MDVYISLIHYPLKTLGVGERVGVWFEGCSIRCQGCISKHTWVQKKENKTTLSKLLLNVKKYNCKKITILGGEPFEQPKALKKLVENLKQDEYEIVIYSGYTYPTLKKNHSDILKYVDVLIDGHFDKNLQSLESFRGSLNQNIYIFNQNLKNSYLEFAKNRDRKIQIVERNNQIYILGIPKIKDVEKFLSH